MYPFSQLGRTHLEPTLFVSLHDLNQFFMLSLNYQLDEQRSRRRQRRNNRDSLEARASRVMNKSFLRLLLNTKSLNNMLSKDKEFFTNLNVSLLVNSKV